MKEVVRNDCVLTHCDPVCIDATTCYVAAVRSLINGGTPEEAYQAAVEIAEEVIVKDLLQYAAKEAIPVKARGTLINGDTSMMGYIGVALQSAFYEMLHAPSFYDGVVAAVARGGDTDTNGAIVAALLGARFGVDEIPKAWIKTVRSAKPRSRALKLNFNIEEIAPQLLKLK